PSAAQALWNKGWRSINLLSPAGRFLAVAANQGVINGLTFRHSYALGIKREERYHRRRAHVRPASFQLRK
ncbi:hypothetical protein, partial [Pseudomonas syringae]|uniref:hypothetical protein n=1 Tax=Pseudomonas syringae TaxID=317 RepID=UPI001F3A1C26